jgi:hypothetical protein
MSIPSNNEAGRDVVVAVGAAALRAGTILAEALSRDLITVPNPMGIEAKVVALDARSVLAVSPLERVGPTARVAEQRHLAIGFVVGVEPFELVQRAKTLVTRLGHGRRGEAWVVYDGLSGDHAARVSIAADEILWVDGRLSPEQARIMFAGQKQVLVALTHSDGFSMRLGDALLCAARDGAGVKTASTPSLPCFATGRCGRLDEMIDVLDERLLAPSAVAADLFVNLSCHGALLSPGADWARSIGAAVGRSRATQTIACWGEVQFDSDDVAAFLTSLAAGCRVGDALVALQQTLRRRGAPALGLLFGDPAHVLDRAAIGMRVAGARTFLPSMPSTKRHAIVAFRVAQISDKNGKHFATALCNQIRKDEKDSESADLGCQDPIGSWGPLLELLLQRAQRLGSMIMHSWLPLAESLPETFAECLCPNCGGWATSRRWRFRDTKIGPRALLTCVACGTVADHPYSTPASIAGASDSDAESRVRFPNDQLVGAGAVLELWPRTLSYRLAPVIMPDGETVSIVKPEPDGISAQRAIISVFVHGQHGLRLHRRPLQLNGRPGTRCDGGQ